MQAIAEFIVKVADLVEAEGRSARSALRAEAKDLRESTGRFLMGLPLVAAGALLGSVGVLLWVLAVYLGVAEAAGPAWGAVAAGLVALGIGGGCLWAFRRMVKS